MLSACLSWIIWDPKRVVFIVPFIERPVVWYGVLFALGFILGYFIFIPIVTRRLDSRQSAIKYVDKMIWPVIAGTIIGARLGHVFFYDWPRYQENLWDIFKVWEGGLASHGGVVGVFLALVFYRYVMRKSYPQYNMVTLLDDIVIPTALVACFIRLGNFFNQEILGIPSIVPWAVIFAHPLDGGPIVPRHPVQLYEAFIYFLTFILLLSLWKIKGKKLHPGLISGLFFMSVFGFRFFLDFLKMPQSYMMDESFLQTGQYLSIPIFLAGVSLFVYSFRHDRIN